MFNANFNVTLNDGSEKRSFEWNLSGKRVEFDYIQPYD